MRFNQFRISEKQIINEAGQAQGETYVIGDSHAKAMGGNNNLAANGARLSAIARQASQVPNGSDVYMTGGHNDVAAGSRPESIAGQVKAIIDGLKSKDCTVNYILFPEGSSNTNQENMAPTREAISSAVEVAQDLNGCSMQGDGIHCSLGSYRGIVQGGTVTRSDSNDQGGDDESIVDGLKAGPPYPREDMEKVKQLQTMLVRAGYSVGRTGVDGKYGPRTANAVKAFKNDYNLKGTGGRIDADAFKTLDAVAQGVAPRATAAAGDNAAAQLRGLTRRNELGPVSQDSVTQGKIGEILNLIAGPESGGNYDAVYPSRRRPEILDMTLEELLRDMQTRIRTNGGSASGRYQYIRKTLRSMIDRMGLDPKTEKFTPAMQDEIAIYHLRADHGLDRWLDGDMETGAFLNRLAGTWAGIPNTSGRSTYAGVGNNAAGITTANAMSALDSIRGVV